MFEDSKAKKRSRVMYIAEATLEYLIAIAVSGAYLATLTKELGMSDSLTGILSSIISLGCLFQLFAVFYRRPKKKNFVITMSVINQLLFILLYIIPFGKGPKNYKSIVFIVVIIAAYFVYNVVHPKKIEWMMSSVDDKKRGKFTATKEAISLLTGMLFTYALGSMVDYFEAKGEVRTALLLSAGILFVIMVLHTLSMIFTVEEVNNQARISNLSESMKDLLTNRDVMSILVLFILIYSATHVATPFYGVYQIGELNFSLTYVSILSIVGSLVRALCSRAWGAYADKKSFVLMLRICLLIYAVGYVFAMLTVPANGKYMMIGYYLCNGISMAGINSCYINLIFDYVEPHKRGDSLAICLALAGLCGFVSTLLVTPLVSLIQRKGLVVLGTTIYAQQVVTFIGLLLVLIMVLYLNKKMIRGTNGQNNN